MRATYQVMNQFQGQAPEVVFTSTRKAEIESRFFWLMKSFSKNSSFSVEHRGIGHAIVTHYGEYGMSESEYFICKA